MQTDVSKWEDQARLFKSVFEWGEKRLDLFVANAGIADVQSLYEVVDAEDPSPLNTLTMTIDLEAVIQGTWLFLHYARRNKQPGGKVVITSSPAGLYPMDACPQYAAAKHAVCVD